MNRSNTYVLVFTAIITIAFGGLLALAAVGLGPLQKKNIELDAKKKILNAVMELKSTDDILSIYKKKIRSLVVGIDGNVVSKNEKGEEIIAEKVNVGKEFKKPPNERLFPVFIYSENDLKNVDAYIIIIYGNGLWNKIWAYLALENDLNTIKGVVFDHAGETPGLGARIVESEVQQRFIDKKIYDVPAATIHQSLTDLKTISKLVSVSFVKGEGHQIPEDNFHEVDGISGATMTTKGVNDMLKKYLSYYENYFNKVLEMQKEQERKTIEPEPVSADTLQSESIEHGAEGE